ncbi:MULTISPECIES: leucine-rich repeat domain-containing protein [Paenibacillus]|uniref:leucine-rich repeat domain-containing protein n=1 Tax=Paenibacillus TaxID=44249 RepID=UPI0022B89C1D|nr:leucine-rich repeat domain-containing protein [Paenibacillus caseinilyticus]MCZ8523286.1 leucine-rich repeat domain-containing protein [Paenibacillus caseinilyticus]
MLKIENDPKGEAYRRLIDYAMEHAAMFALADGRIPPDEDEPVVPGGGRTGALLRRLQPYLLRTYTMDEVRRRNAIGYGMEGTVYVYRCCTEAAEVLKKAASSMYAWQCPDLPEDLSFWDADEEDFLSNTAHEEMLYIRLSEEEGRALAEAIPGVFVRGTFNRELDAYLDDALRHGAEKVYLMRNGLQEIPEKLLAIRTLTHLTIFEQDIRRLPPGLFELHRLESLTVNTADLEAIPPEIGRLENLEYLSIGCCSYDRPDQAEHMIGIGEVTLRELPPEIGQLTKLQCLHINATGLRQIPAELAQLKELQVLDLSRNRLEEVPGRLLKKLPNLKYSTFEGNPLAGP